MRYLEEINIEFEVIDIIHQPLSESELKEVLEKLNNKPSEILRKTEALFVEQFSRKDFSEEDILQILIIHPSLIQRPILIKGNSAIIARPIESVESFIKK